MTDSGAAQEDPSASPAKRLDIAGTFVKQVLVILYPIGTILGLIYAHWYYETFNISFLSHATPLDLLLVALANADKVTFIFGVAIALTIVILAIFRILVLANWGRAVIVAAFVSIAKFSEVLWKAVIVVVLHLYVVIGLLPTSWVALSAVLIVALFKGRTTTASWWKGEAADNHSISARFRMSLYWWMSARSCAVHWQKCVLPKALSDWKSDKSQRFCAARKTRKRLNKLLTDNRVVIFLLFLVVVSAFIAVRSGVIDSKCISKENDGGHCALGRSFDFAKSLDYGMELFWLESEGGSESKDGRESGGDSSGQEGDAQNVDVKNDDGEDGVTRDAKQADALGRAVIVPTANVAALEYLYDDSVAGRKHVRVTIRQDAEGRGFSRCLTDIGATDSAQFLFDFNDDKERFAGREECLSELNADGGCERTASIPFSRGSATLDGKGDQKMDIAQNCTPRSGCKSRSKRCSSFDCLVEVINAKAADGLIPAKLRLIGRADSLPINNGSFRSNDGLAQARAEEVWKRLRSRGWKWLDDVDVLRLIGGPLSPFYCDVCDRSVDVHICWEPAEGAGPTGGAGERGT